MPTEAKRATVAELAEAFSTATSAVVATHSGLTVAELGRIRSELRGKGISYRVVKNRLGRIAAEQAGRAELSPLLVGPSAVATGGSDEAALAKGVIDALRPFRDIEIRGGTLGGATVDAAAITRLASLPPREVLLAQLAGGMASPLGTMAGLLAAPLRNLGYALAQVRDQREAA
jgi:large subunit ribosomal protein L10